MFSRSPARAVGHHGDATSSVELGYKGGGPAAQMGFFEGLLGCLRPVWTIIGKATQAELKQQGEWARPRARVCLGHGVLELGARSDFAEC